MPNESVAACWYINNTCWIFLSHDDASWGIHDGIYNETPKAADGHGQHRVPSGANEYFNDQKDSEKWDIIQNDGWYYTGHDNGALGLNLLPRYTNPLDKSVTIYHIKHNNVDHYFSAPSLAEGNDANKSG